METTNLDVRDCIEKWKRENPPSFERAAHKYGQGDATAYWEIKKTLSEVYGFEMSAENRDLVMTLLWDLSEEKKKSDERKKEVR